MVGCRINTRLRRWKASGPDLPWVCLVLFFWSALSAVSEMPSPSDDWLVRSWQTKDGLPQNTVYAILQTHDGYLWIGTAGGLARFDGVRFRTFGLQDGLRSVQISALVEDRQGVLWVGTRGGGLSRRQEGGQIRTFSSERGFPATTVEALATGRDGSVWVGTPRGLVKECADRFTVVGATAGLPEKQVRALLEDAHGVLWVSFTLEGLYRGTSNVFQRVEETRSAPTPVYSMCQDRDGNVWAGGGNGYLWKLGEGSCERFEQTNGVPFQMIECLAQGAQGPLWIGTRSGGLHFFGEGIFQKVSQRAGLTGNTIRGLVVDRDGGVWAGTVGGGLNRLSAKLLRVLGAREGLEHTTVTSVAEDRAGRLWVATQEGGVYLFQEGRFSRVKEPSVWANSPNAYTILATADGSIWAAGESFLYRFEQGHPAKAYADAPVAGEAIRAMCEDEHCIWLGTYYSTLLKVDAKGVRVVLTNGLAGDIRSLVRDGPESLWIGTAAGLYHWQHGKLKAWTTRDGLASAMIETLYRDPDGTLWIGTLGGGLARLRGGRILNITTRQGLADDVISQIVSDDFGHLWLGCNHGIMRVERSEIDALAAGKTSFVHASVLGQNEGMLKEQCTGGHSPTAVKTRAGRLLFPTADGIVEIDPRQWQDSPAVIPQASIEEIRVEGQLQSGGPELVLAPGSRHLEVNYGAPSLRGADLVHFRFRLEPLDKQWVNAGLRRTAYYGSLRPGRYTFRVTTGGTRGDWNESSAVLAIIAKPYYWQTLWFQLLMAAALIAAIAGWYFRRLIRLEEKRAAQEAFTRQLLLSQEHERKRVASELHDGVGQDLLLIKNRVGLLAADTKHPPEIARKLSEISRDATRAIADVRAISHALRPGALDQVGLTKAVEWMIEQIAGTTTTKFSTEIENIDGLLAPDKEINVYRIVQEALNNVMKHAHASHVLVEMRRQPGELWVSVLDNGRGFDPMRADRDGEKEPGLGLPGMAERGKVLGGRIDLQTAPGKGTRLTLTVPLLDPGKRYA
jgi:signal transduction histidine kinase/ligand-binding sensor domain-containing protein